MINREREREKDKGRERKERETDREREKERERERERERRVDRGWGNKTVISLFCTAQSGQMLMSLHSSSPRSASRD